ncbi:ATP/GTP-binding protein [Streptomyces sp. BH097]|uniref:ATP/GTP-binding protein n=1 Tax=unclassified Streptomyces TaxID=2593676 RepID=UPI003BB80B46
MTDHYREDCVARDLRAVFGSNDRELAADEAFTNRQAQWAHVTTALAEHLRRVSAPGFDVEDLEAQRRNVLVFHGVGGIGKTTLSRKIEAALGGARPEQWSAAAWPGARLVPVRIDLARSAGTDIEQVVLTLRLALAELGRPLPAFDIALRRYWEATHPGEPLEEYLRRGGLARRFGEALPQQMQSALADVAQALLLPGTIGSVVGEVAGTLVGALRERRQTVRALAGCARLADLLDAEADIDALSYYPHLLAWEIARLPATERVIPVVLLDTFEDVGDRTRREMERLLQRVVWLMPNALFIITGRSRLDWAEDGLAGQLDFTGPHAWPGLAHPSSSTVPGPRTTDSSWAPERQVLIGDFSLQDSEDYLVRRLSRQGRPLIDAELRRVISERSHGLPLYLDLSVMRFLQLRRSGRTPQPADFDADFPALISRTLQDLTPDERHVLRSVALLDAFDVPLATAAAGLTHEAAALRLIERPFVRHHPFGIWPHHLHALIRATLRTADDHTDDRWSTRDWQQAAERAFAALETQWRTSQETRTLLVGCLRQGLALARDFVLPPGWLTDAAWAYVGDSVWEPITLTAPLTPPGEAAAVTPADTVVDLLTALARRQHEHREHTVNRLTAVLDAGLLPDELVEMATYYRAKAQRDLGRSADSRTGMQYVVDHGGRLAPAARRGLVHLARLAGDFTTAHATAQHLGWEGRQHRVLGDVFWPQGDMERAATEFLAGRTEAEQHGKAGEAAHNQALRALVTAFTDPRLADDEIDLARHLLTGLTLRATTLTVQIAALVRDAGLTDDVEDRARLLRTELTNAGLTSQRPLLELALAFHHAVLGDDSQIDARLACLSEVTAGGDYAYYTDLTCFMADRLLPTGPAQSLNWLDGETVVRERWRALVVTRQLGPAT